MFIFYLKNVLFFFHLSVSFCFLPVENFFFVRVKKKERVQKRGGKHKSHNQILDKDGLGEKEVMLFRVRDRERRGREGGKV